MTSKLFTDHLGSLVAMQASNGYLVPGSRAYYLPFGGYRGTPPSRTLTDRGFTGQKSNNQPATDLGLLYYNARYYLPAIAKFASADTVVPDPAGPQQFNRYAYTLNNPVKFTDPAGHTQHYPMTFNNTQTQQLLQNPNFAESIAGKG